MVSLARLTEEGRGRRRWLWLMVGIGVGIRIGLGVVNPLRFPDSVDYDTLAHAILNHQVYEVPNTLPGSGGGFSLASRMPGYPVFMAAMYAISHNALHAVMVAQGILGGLCILFTYLIGQRINNAVALTAATLVTFDPLTVGFTAAVLTETPFTFCMMLSLWLLLKIMEQPHAWWRWILLGEIWGIGVYFRASALWCLVPLVVFAALAVPLGRSGGPGGGGRERLKRVMGAVAALLMMFGILSPWLVRNYRIFQSGPLRMTTLEGLSLYEAVYPGADGGPKQDKIKWPPEFLKLNEAQRNDEWARRAREAMVADPLRIARLAVVKMERTWSPTFNGGEFRGPNVQNLMLAWHVPLFVFAAIGLLLFHAGTGRESWWPKWKWLLIMPVIYFTAVHSIYLGSVRYRVPLMPIVCIFAAAGIYSMLKRLGWVKRGADDGVYSEDLK